MQGTSLVVCCVCLRLFVLPSLGNVNQATEELERNVLTLRPSVLAVFLARNKAHTLPYFLGYFEQQRYPKDRISIWIHTDHNEDDTERVLREWKNSIESFYQRVDLISSSDVVYSEMGVDDWPPERYRHLLSLRDRALDVAKERQIDYVLYIDMDNILVNPNTLSQLVAQHKPIVAPMSEPSSPRSTYSNFWCGVTERGFYLRTDDYFPTLYRERRGCFDVPMVHSTYLIDMQSPGSQKLTFIPDQNYDGVIDDLVVFAYQVKKAGMKMFVLNTEKFMIMSPTSGDYSSLSDEQQKTEEIFINALATYGPIVRSQYLPHTKPELTDFGLDKIYVINLKRRESRRFRLQHVFEDLGIKAEFTEAVDGRNLTDKELKEFGIRMMDGYEDPIKHRPLTLGEIGCFLSHYNIWAEMLSSQLKAVLILEDDPYFSADFRRRFYRLLTEVRENKIDWDLIYLGRKHLENAQEPAVEGAKTLVHPGYSYWALAYMLSKDGAKKLIDQRPLGRMMAVDEYLPIMFDQHPRNDWKAHFRSRNLKAFSARHLLISPTHYTNDYEYFSDTESSVLHTEAARKKDEL